MLNPDGSYQQSGRPFPTVRRALIAALGLKAARTAREAFLSDKYVGWNGDREREIDWQSGCCILLQGDRCGRWAVLMNGSSTIMKKSIFVIGCGKQGARSDSPRR